MAIAYMELELLNPPGEALEIPMSTAVVFDTIVSYEGTEISYNMGTGEITFHDPGYYYIDWYVSPQFGLTTDGSNFALITSDADPPTIGSSHVRVAPAVGFAILHVVTGGKTAQLINVSDDDLTLSEAVNTKAALIVYEIAKDS